MGIVNVTPDSFSDGGKYDSFEAACDYARLLVEQGATIIDVGGESTRPGSDELDPKEELARVLPVVSQLAGEGVFVSIDTRHAFVARACVEAGAVIINDVSGFREQAMVDVAAKCDAGLIVVHMLGEPNSMQLDPSYTDVVREVSGYLCEQAQRLEAEGVIHERISIDPGPGFGKTFEHNLALIRATPMLAALGYPLVAALSRKAFVGQLTGVESPEKRVAGSVSLAVYAATLGARILRVHDVAATVEALRALFALKNTGGPSRVFIGLGSNMGDRAATLRAAIERIAALPDVTLISSSSLFESEPAYRKDQEMFCNAVIEIDTVLAPFKLLKALQGIEDEFGRARSHSLVNGPRSLDLDIIDYEGVVCDDPELMLPHPLALERDFVVTPLQEIAPDFVFADGSTLTRDAVEQGRVTAQNGEPVFYCELRSGTEAQQQRQSGMENQIPQSRAYPDEPLKRPKGLLSICAIPIGNLGDITQRVIDRLSGADTILAEDTRVARRLLSHLNIHAKIERCDENTIRLKAPQIIERIKQGSEMVYISDAGMPGISDPGAVLVEEAQKASCPLEVLPGASSVLTAVVASGLPARAFYFGGFLPRKKSQIVETFEQLKQLNATLVFFESPHRTAASLAVIAEVFPLREAAIARELTKLHEEVLRAPAPELALQIAEREKNGQGLKGELVLLIGPPPKQTEKRVHKDRYAHKSTDT